MITLDWLFYMGGGGKRLGKSMVEDQKEEEWDKSVATPANEASLLPELALEQLVFGNASVV